MHVETLAIRGLRCLSDITLDLPPAGAWLLGANGSGKTSVLEGLHLLGFGRSFRGRVADGVVQRGREALEVVAHWRDEEGRARVSGLRHAGESWEARLDGSSVGSLSELAAPFPVLCFHPESSALVTGSAEDRRRALDWLAFHVEPGFSDIARRYARALKQRNALLRTAASDAEFEPWEREMSLTAEALSERRVAALGLWQPALDRLWPALVGAPESPRIELRPGWRRGVAALADVLLLNRGRDRDLGFTTIGPQRADLSLGGPFGVEAGQLSRGQAKVVALALVLAQAEALRHWSGERSLLLLDDLQAELDPERQAGVIRWVCAEGYQAVVSGTVVSPDLLASTPDWGRFHVEQGLVSLRESL